MSVLYPDQVFAPCRGALGDQTPEAGFHLEAFGLAISLQVVSQGQAGCSSAEPTELSPELGHKLGPLVSDDVLGKPVDLENLVHRDLCCFLGRGQLRQGYESSHLGETVNHSENRVVALSPVTKSMDISDHGLEGMGNGCKRTMQDLENVLFLAQTEHASTYSRTSSSIDGHQNCWEMANIVL